MEFLPEQILDSVYMERVIHQNDLLLAVNAARVSMNKRSNEYSERDDKLVKYLLDHNHFTPFTHPKIATIQLFFNKDTYFEYMEYEMTHKYNGKEVIPLNDIYENSNRFFTSDFYIVLEVSSLYTAIKHTKTPHAPQYADYKVLMGYVNIKDHAFSNGDDCIIPSDISEFTIPENQNKFEFKDPSDEIYYKPYLAHLFKYKCNYNIRSSVTEDQIREKMKEIHEAITHYTFFVKAPFPIRTQIYKHKYGVSENEMSRRYVEDDVELFIPKDFRGKPEKNIKQGSSDKLIDVDRDRIKKVCDANYTLYQELLDQGVSVEQARYFLPQATITQFYITASIKNYNRIFKLRLSKDAQYDTRIAIKNYMYKEIYGDNASEFEV